MRQPEFYIVYILTKILIILFFLPLEQLNSLTRYHVRSCFLTVAMARDCKLLITELDGTPRLQIRLRPRNDIPLQENNTVASPKHKCLTLTVKAVG